jgi:hypothetical protein
MSGRSDLAKQIISTTRRTESPQLAELSEIKLGGDRLIEDGVKTLLKLSDKIDTTKMKAPSFMAVFTAVGQYAFKRADGVYVVPIGCLKD